MAEKIPKWECELWSYISRGDGMHCPLYGECQIRRRRGNSCADDLREVIAGIIDSEQFNPNDYGFLELREAGGIFQRVEILAKRYLEKGGVGGPPVPVELVSLADYQHAIKVHLLPLRVYHGAIWHMRDGWVIQLRKDDTSARKRFTLFHEAFHILAHCRTSPVFRQRGLEQGSFNELLADYFATCVLAPRKWVTERWAEVEDLDRMAEIFDVPKSVMWLRLREIGLI